jgi:hypothetical protein
VSKYLAGNTPAQDEATGRALAEGLMRVYFPNGTSYMDFECNCGNCRHFIEDQENIKPPKLEPPHNICSWGVLDRIVHCMAVSPYGYGTSFHHPDDMEIVDEFWPRCKRFTPRGYGGDDRDPPTPDAPGQLTFGEIDVPVEQVRITMGVKA